MTEREILVKATNWCCMGPWPQADCEHVLSHFHADCKTGSCDRFNAGERIWGASPADVIEKMRQHIAQAHDNEPGQQELFTIGGL